MLLRFAMPSANRRVATAPSVTADRWPANSAPRLLALERAVFGFPKSSHSCLSPELIQRLFSQGNTRQVNGLLDSGRNSLLESAQEATLPSLATSALQRQTKDFPAQRAIPHYKHT
jgi:hypothetical protein